MNASTVLSNALGSALPSVQGRPLRNLPPRLYGYVLRTSLRQQVALCLLTVLAFPLTLAPLELQRRIIDGAIANDDVRLLLLLGGLYLLAVVVHRLLRYVRDVYTDRVAEGVIRLLRRRIAQGGELASERDDGTRQSIIAAEAENVGGFVAESIAFPLLQAGIVISILGYLAVVEPVIAAVAVAFMTPSILLVALMQPVLNRLSGQKIDTTRRLAGRLLDDRPDGAGQEGSPDSLIERIYGLRLSLARVKHAMKGLNNLLGQLGPLSILVVGGWMVIQGATEIGTIVAAISGYERMTGPARDLLNFYRRLSMMGVQYRLIRGASVRP